jgi:hypothetical protein
VIAMRSNQHGFEPAVPQCTRHDWALRPDASGRRVQRFWCLVCHAWGYILWRRRGRRSLRVYRNRREPEEHWFLGAEPDETRAVRLRDFESQGRGLLESPVARDLIGASRPPRTSS